MVRLKGRSSKDLKGVQFPRGAPSGPLGAFGNSMVNQAESLRLEQKGKCDTEDTARQKVGWNKECRPQGKRRGQAGSAEGTGRKGDNGLMR